MGGVSTQSLAVLAQTGGAAKVGTSGGSTVEAFLQSLSTSFSTLDSTVSGLSASLANYLPLAGGTVSGDVNLNNNVFVRGKNTSGVALPLIAVDNTNIARFGTNSSQLTATDIITHTGGSISLKVDSFNAISVNGSGTRLGGGNARVSTIYDEDNMASNSATALATQQSIKAYVDNSIAAIPEPGLVLLTAATVSSAVAAVDVVLPGSYDEYILEVLNIVPSTDDAYLRMRTSTNGGSTFDSGASDYAYLWRGVSDDSSSAIDCIKLCYETTGFGVGNAANENGFSGSFKLISPKVAGYCQILAEAGYKRADSAEFLHTFTLGARRLAAADVDAVRLYFNTGNIASGKLALYGVNR